MKNLWIWVGVAILVVLVLGYLGRHQIKSMLGMAPTPAPVVQATTPPTSQAMQASSAAAPSDNIYLTKTIAQGNYMTDFQGMTVYTYDKDTTGVSNCTDACAKNWLPYTSGATAESQLPTNITVITRTDGSKQFAWKGMPLYYFAKDKQAGDTTGDGVAGVWHIVKL